MAAVLATVTATSFNSGQFVVNGTLTTSGNYVVNGTTVDLSGTGVPSGAAPVYVDVWEQSAVGSANSGWQYQFVPGTTQANGRLQIFNSTTQLTATTFPAATLYFQAFFPKL